MHKCKNDARWATGMTLFCAAALNHKISEPNCSVNALLHLTNQLLSKNILFQTQNLKAQNVQDKLCSNAWYLGWMVLKTF